MHIEPHQFLRESTPTAVQPFQFPFHSTSQARTYTSQLLEAGSASVRPGSWSCSTLREASSGREIQ
jgi:hypothetical protein